MPRVTPADPIKEVLHEVQSMHKSRGRNAGNCAEQGIKAQA